MEGSTYWTTLDAASAYWSMPLEEEDKEKTAFSVPRGKFEFNVTPYGLCNAEASYQQMIYICVAGLPADRVLAYVDDIVIFSSTFAEHISSLESVFPRLRSAGVTLTLSGPGGGGGTKFLLNSDHNPLVQLRKQKDPHGNLRGGFPNLKNSTILYSIYIGVDNLKADPFSRNRAAGPIQPASDFESKIYAVAIRNNNFSYQIHSEQCSDPIISMAKCLILNGLEITTGRLKRVRKQLRVENDMLTKSGRPVLHPLLRKFVVAEIHNIAQYGVEKTYS